MLKFVFKHNDITSTVYFDELNVFFPQIDLDQKSLVDRLQHIARALVEHGNSLDNYAKYNVLRINRKTAFTYSLVYADLNGDYPPTSIDENAPPPPGGRATLISVEEDNSSGEKNTIKADILKDETLTSNTSAAFARIPEFEEQAKKPGDFGQRTITPPKPTREELCSGYKPEAAAAVFHLDWGTLNTKIGQEVSRRMNRLVGGVQESLSKLKVDVAAIEADAADAEQASDHYDQHKFQAFVAEKLEELHLPEFYARIEKVIEDESNRLARMRKGRLEEEVRSRYKIYEEAQVQFRYFHRLLAWHLYEAARKYWEYVLVHEQGSIDDKRKTFEERLACIGIHTNASNQLTDISATYRIFDAINSLEASQELIKTLLVKCNQRVGLMTNGLWHIHEGLKDFAKECQGSKECPSVFDFEPYRDCMKDLFTTFSEVPEEDAQTSWFNPRKAYDYAASAVSKVWNKTTFSWNPNAIRFEELVKERSKVDYTDRFNKTIEGTPLPVEPNLSLGMITIHKVVSHDVDNDGPANKALGEANDGIMKMLRRINGDPEAEVKNGRQRKKRIVHIEGYQHSIPHSNSDDNLQTESIKQQIEKRKEFLKIVKLQQEGKLAYEEANGLLNKYTAAWIAITETPAPPAIEDEQWRTNLYNIKVQLSQRAALALKKAQDKWKAIIELREKVNNPKNNSTQIADTPGRMRDLCAELRLDVGDLTSYQQLINAVNLLPALAAREAVSQGHTETIAQAILELGDEASMEFPGLALAISEKQASATSYSTEWKASVQALCNQLSKKPESLDLKTKAEVLQIRTSKAEDLKSKAQTLLARISQANGVHDDLDQQIGKVQNLVSAHRKTVAARAAAAPKVQTPPLPRKEKEEPESVPAPAQAPEVPAPSLSKEEKILADVDKLIQLIENNVPYWSSKLKYLGGESWTNEKGEAFKVQKGIKIMLNAIQAYKKEEHKTTENATFLFKNIVGAAREAEERSRSFPAILKYGFLFFNVRKTVIDVFYQGLANSTLENVVGVVDNWDKSYGPKAAAAAAEAASLQRASP